MVKLYPKTSLGLALLYTVGAIAWLAAMGIAALWFRTILLNPNTNPKVGYALAPLYYFLVTFHGQAAMMIIVDDVCFSIFAYALYKSNMSTIHNKLLTILFWFINVPLIVTFAGGPITGWYMYPPLALQSGSWINPMFSKNPDLIGLAYFMMFVNAVAVTVTAIVMFIDALKTRPKEGKIPIFAAYTMMFSGAFIFLTEPALAACELWYVLYFWAHVPVNPLTWVVLFWFWGHPIVYYAPFPLFGGLYALIPQFAGRPLYSERWARWNILILFTFGMTAWVHHLQTWPLPVYIRAFMTPTTLILAAGSGLTALNLGLTIATGKKYDYKNPVGFAALVALIGFILAGLQALINPINPLDVLVHNTYYIVGHFHLMIWTIIIVGYVAVLLDMLKSAMGNLMDLSGLSRGLIYGGLGMWTFAALGAGYAMSYAGYEGLIRRWVAYPVKFQPFMDAISYFSIMMGVSFIMYALPVIATLLRIKISAFWERVEAPSVPAGTSFTMNTSSSGGSNKK